MQRHKKTSHRHCYKYSKIVDPGYYPAKNKKWPDDLHGQIFRSLTANA